MPISTNQQLLAKLYEDIVVGTFAAGTKLVEERLVDRYGTKRHVLREAFNQLEEIRFVERIPNRGVFVREPKPQEVRELFQLRELLETHAAYLMSLPAPADTIEQMKDIQAQHTAATRASQYREVLHLNTLFHRVQYLACGNPTLATAIEDYATRTHLITAMKFGDARLMEEVISQHEAIISAMMGTDHEALADSIRAHFDMARVDRYQRQYDLRHSDEDHSGEPEPRRRIAVQT